MGGVEVGAVGLPFGLFGEGDDIGASGAEGLFPGLPEVGDGVAPAIGAVGVAGPDVVESIAVDGGGAVGVAEGIARVDPLEGPARDEFARAGVAKIEEGEGDPRAGAGAVVVAEGGAGGGVFHRDEAGEGRGGVGGGVAVKGAVAVDAVGDEIDEDAEVGGVRGAVEVEEVGFDAEGGVDAIGLGVLIAVVGGGGEDGGGPEGGDAERGEVGECGGHAAEVAVAVRIGGGAGGRVGACVGWIVIGIAPGDGHDLIEDFIGERACGPGRGVGGTGHGGFRCGWLRGGRRGLGGGCRGDRCEREARDEAVYEAIDRRIRGPHQISVAGGRAIAVTGSASEASLNVASSFCLHPDAGGP